MTAFLDCEDDSTGTVADLDGPAVSDSDSAPVAEKVPELGPGPGDRGPVSLQETLGAVYGWVRWERVQWVAVSVSDPELCQVCFEPLYQSGYVWCMLYWRVLEFSGEAPQVSAVRAGGIWSGYMSEARGLSWDRKSRYGKK